MSKNKIIEPSLLAFYQNDNIQAILNNLKELNIKQIHYDVMDGVYVNNTTFTTEYLEIISQSKFDIEVHLMVKKPIELINTFSKFDCVKTIVFHPSVLTKNELLQTLIQYSKDKKLGLAININENLDDYVDLLPICKTILIMGVNAGFSGQKINEVGINHLVQAYNLKKINNFDYEIGFDGGIDNETIQLIAKYCDEVVSGSYLINQTDLKSTYLNLLDLFEGI